MENYVVIGEDIWEKMSEGKEQIILETRQCKICGEVKPLTVTFWSRHCRVKDGFRHPCKECINIAAAKNPKQQRTLEDGSIIRTCRKCKKEKLLVPANWPNQANGYGLRWECRECYYKRHKIYYNIDPKKFNLRTLKAEREIRMIVLSHYSKGTFKCSCSGCNETNLEFLAIDHIEGGGSQHQKIIKNKLARWLYINGFPDGYRILCHNCNMSYGLYGYCPHQSPDLAGSLRKVKRG